MYKLQLIDRLVFAKKYPKLMRPAFAFITNGDKLELAQAAVIENYSCAPESSITITVFNLEDGLAAGFILLYTGSNCAFAQRYTDHASTIIDA